MPSKKTENKTTKKDSKKTSKKVVKKEKIYCGIENPIPSGYRLGSMQECFDAGKVMYYGIKKVDSIVLNSKKNNTIESYSSLVIKKAGLSGKKTKLEKIILKTTDIVEKDKLKKEYNLLINDIKKIDDLIKKTKK